MQERTVAVTTPEGEMPTFVVRPEIRPAKAVVVMLMDGRGWREALFDQARRLASVGYYVMFPNLFYRHAGKGPIENVLDMAWMTELNTAITQPKAGADVDACLAFAAADPAAPKGKAGVMGFCMGGRLSVTVSQQLGDRIAAAAALHPGYLATRAETSPHLALNNISAELYLGVAEHDEHLSPGAVARFKAALDAAKVNYTLEVLPGSGHGYSTPGNEEYHKPSAEKAWERIFDLFERRLAPA
jgi:carboxymethylenebutenolidase